VLTSLAGEERSLLDSLAQSRSHSRPRARLGLPQSPVRDASKALSTPASVQQLPRLAQRGEQREQWLLGVPVRWPGQLPRCIEEAKDDRDGRN
jgi:hypothetical protein